MGADLRCHFYTKQNLISTTPDENHEEKSYQLDFVSGKMVELDYIFSGPIQLQFYGCMSNY